MFCILEGPLPLPEANLSASSCIDDFEMKSLPCFYWDDELPRMARHPAAVLGQMLIYRKRMPSADDLQ
jgi:hypothetical protein